MKRWSPLVVFLLLGPFSLLAETAQQTYARGVRAFAGGNLDAARKLFAEVVAADPGNSSAIAYLRNINAAKRSRADLRKQLEGVILPKVAFRDASISAVLDYLPKVVAEQSHGKVTLNIVRLIPADFGNTKMVTLELENVPVSSVLDYLAQLAGMKIVYQAHAVVVSLPTGGSPAPPPGAQ